MVLRPRKFKFKNIQKRRSSRYSKPVRLLYGQIGLFILQPLRLTGKKIYRFKLFLKKSSRKSDKTLRFFWFHIFPHIPVSRKVSGSRMGKGKGKNAAWAIELPSGVTLFEFKNLRAGRAIYFCKQAMHKLPVESRIIKRHHKVIPSIWNPSKKFTYDVIW